MAATDFDFTQTRDDIITRAFRVVGVIGVDDVLTAGQLKQGADILNALVKAWQTRGTFLWTWKSFSITLVTGQASYDPPTDPPLLFIESGKLNYSTGGSKLVEPISYLEYLKIEDLTEAGPIELITIGSDDKIYVWPVPDSATYSTLTGIGVTRAKDWDTAGSDGEFPAQWVNALVYGVASDLSAEYGVPVRERQQLKFESESAFSLAKRGERPRTNRAFIKSAYYV